MYAVDRSTALFYDMGKDNSGGTLCVLAEIEGILSERFVVGRIGHVLGRYPVLSKTIVKHDQGVEWKDHALVNARDHFKLIERKKYDKRGLQRFVSSLLQKDFVQGQPEWEFNLLTYEQSNKSYLLFKSSHIYGDGHQVSHYLRLFMDDPGIKYPKANVRLSSVFYKIYAFVVALVSLLFVMLYPRPKESAIDRRCARHDRPRFLHCKTWALKEVRRVKDHFGVSINDLFYTIITQAMREYCGEDIQVSSLSMFNLRDLSSFAPDECSTMKKQNDIGFIAIRKKVTSDLTGNLRDNSSTLSYFKHSPFISILVQVMKGICWLFPPFSSFFMRQLCDKSTFEFSNFRAFGDEKRIDGKRVTNISNAVIPYRVGSLFTLVSYFDKITLNVTFRERNITDQKKFIRCVDNAYCELKDRALGW